MAGTLSNKQSAQQQSGAQQALPTQAQRDMAWETAEIEHVRAEVRQAETDIALLTARM